MLGEVFIPPHSPCSPFQLVVVHSHEFGKDTHIHPVTQRKKWSKNPHYLQVRWGRRGTEGAGRVNSLPAGGGRWEAGQGGELTWPPCLGGSQAWLQQWAGALGRCSLRQVQAGWNRGQAEQISLTCPRKGQWQLTGVPQQISFPWTSRSLLPCHDFKGCVLKLVLLARFY